MSDNPEVCYVRPVFFVANCEASLRFYAALGFSEGWRHEEDGRVLVVSDPDGNELFFAPPE